MKNYLLLFLLGILVIAGCQTDKKKDQNTTPDSTQKTETLVPNVPEITDLTIDEFNKKATVKFKIPRKINVSLLVTDAQEVGIQGGMQVKDAVGDQSYDIDISKLKKGLYFVFVVTHENKKVKKEMIIK